LKKNRSQTLELRRLAPIYRVSSSIIRFRCDKSRFYRNAPIKPKIQLLTFWSKSAMITGIKTIKNNKKTTKYWEKKMEKGRSESSMFFYVVCFVAVIATSVAVSVFVSRARVYSSESFKTMEKIERHEAMVPRNWEQRLPTSK